MKDSMHRVEALSMVPINCRKWYSAMGIESNWAEADMCKGHPRVAASDDQCGLLAQLCFGLVDQRAKRNLILSRGLPRRQALLTDSATAPQFLQEFKRDAKLFSELEQCTFSGASAMVARSVFNKKSARQLQECLS
eukprot:3565747-Pyramimonas_sp.AAC.1